MGAARQLYYNPSARQLCHLGTQYTILCAPVSLCTVFYCIFFYEEDYLPRSSRLLLCVSIYIGRNMPAEVASLFYVMRSIPYPESIFHSNNVLVGFCRLQLIYIEKGIPLCTRQV